MQIASVGIDLGKTTFHLVALAGAALRDQGHDLRLIPAQFVKPCVRTSS
jgi:hypothetical protein